MEAFIGKKVKIHIDREVSEYLGNHRTTPIDVTENTLAHDPPHPETFSDMKYRVKSHHHKITKHTKQTSCVIWIITHGLIMKQVASLVGIKMLKEFPSLTCLSIMDGDKNSTGQVIMFHDGTNNEDLDEDCEMNTADSMENNEIPMDQ